MFTFTRTTPIRRDKSEYKNILEFNNLIKIEIVIPVGFLIASDIANDISQSHNIIFGQSECFNLGKFPFHLNVRYNSPQFLIEKRIFQS